MKLYTAALIAIFVLAFIIRFIGLTQVPPGLYIDEVSIGYNAYKILTTGKDEYGAPMPMVFKAFGEYKMPVYIYLTVAAMAILGKTEFAVRLPGAATGMATVVIFYFLLREVTTFDKTFVEKKREHAYLLFATLLFTLSPWHVMFSRTGFEATAGLFFYILSLYLFVRFLRIKNPVLLTGSLLSLATTVYSYNSYKAAAPVTFLFFLYLLLKNKMVTKKIWGRFIITALIMAPMLLFTLTASGSTRFAQTSAFVGYESKPLQVKLLTYPLIYLQNYSSYLSTTYLFSWGDGWDRQHVPGFGNQPRWQLLFFLYVFVLAILYRKRFGFAFLLFLVFVSPLAGGLTRPSPHAVRSLPLIIPFIAFVAYGCTQLLFTEKRYLKIAGIFLLSIALYETGLFYHYYFNLYPHETIISWGGGYKDTVQALTAYQTQNKYAVIVSQIVGNDYAFFKYYNDKLQYTEIAPTGPWQRPNKTLTPKLLYVTANAKDPRLTILPHKLLKEIYSPGTTDVFVRIYEI